jgi:hypothetical protein
MVSALKPVKKNIWVLTGPRFPQVEGGLEARTHVLSTPGQRLNPSQDMPAALVIPDCDMKEGR